MQMGWFSKLFGKSSEFTSKGNLPLFPIWLEQQGNISIQDGIDCYIKQFMSLEPLHLTYSKVKTIEQCQKEVATIEVEVMLLKQCQTFYGVESMSPDFNDLLSTKSLALQASKDLLEMKLSRERLVKHDE